MPGNNEFCSGFWNLGGGAHKELCSVLQSQLSCLRGLTLIDEMTGKFFLLLALVLPAVIPLSLPSCALTLGERGH